MIKAPCFVFLKTNSYTPVPGLHANIHVGAYDVYKGEGKSKWVARQTMLQEPDGTLRYEGDIFKIVDPTASTFTTHGFTGTVMAGGEIVWNHGYTSVPRGVVQICYHTACALAPFMRKRVQKAVLATCAPCIPAQLLSAVTAANDPDNHVAIAGLVVKALAEDPGWRNADVNLVEVKDVSGGGGSKTLKVTAPPPAGRRWLQRWLSSDDRLLAPNPPAVCVHSRPEDHGEFLMQRMGMAAKTFASHGVAPLRLAEGTDWFVDEWRGSGTAEDDSIEMWQKMGQLLGKVHSEVPTEWFEEFRKMLMTKFPGLKDVPKGSHIWAYFARNVQLNDFGVFTDPANADLLKEYADPGAFGPVHPVAQRIVSAHCDFHPGNIIVVEDLTCMCVDFEFTVVTHAVQDLAFGIACCDGNMDFKKAFLTAYLEVLGEPSDDLDTLLRDCELAHLASWHSGGKLAMWEMHKSSKDEVLEVVHFCKDFAAQVRASTELQGRVIKESLKRVIPGFFPKSYREKMQKSAWYAKVQSALEEAAASVQPSTTSCKTPDVAEGFVIKALNESSLVLQVRPGTDRLELGSLGVDDSNQKWRKLGDRLQHVGTGLFLDADTNYPFYQRGQPWESCGTELFVRPWNDSDNQRWTFDGTMIRQVIGGRALDVNSWELKSGKGVNLNMPHTSMYGCSWSIGGSVDSVEQEAEPALAAPTITDVPAGVEFHIKPALNQDMCLSTRADGYTKDPFEIYLAKVDGSLKQKWKLIDGNQFQNADTGQFLDSELKYPFMTNIDHIWEDNHSHLRTRPQDYSDAQKWVLGPEEFHGGKVLRHFRDGRAVDVHGWNLRDGNNMGCENSIHSDCKGISYILSPVK